VPQWFAKKVKAVIIFNNVTFDITITTTECNQSTGLAIWLIKVAKDAQEKP
jgi:hypothetical protein